MAQSSYEKQSRIGVCADRLWRWHVAPGALARLNPPWQPARIEDPGQGVAEGSRVVLRVKTGPFWQRWVAEHKNIEEGRQFEDVQVEGPFGAWAHTHLFDPEGTNASSLLDRVQYAPPLGALGRALGGGVLRRALERLFTWRHATTKGDLETHARSGPARPLRVLITGSHGLVGSALVAFLSTGGHEVVRLSRGERLDGAASWNPARGTVHLEAAGTIDAVVHLAGENIAARRWNDAQKARIKESRATGTRLLAEALAAMPAPPKVLVSASASGIYGDRGDETLTEASATGDGFLAEVGRIWEEATRPAAAAGIRVVNVRIGVVLDAGGGALPKLLGPARFGLGGRLGSGKQWWPWVSLDDLLGTILKAVSDESLEGPLNAVAPQAVTQLEMAKTLGRVLGRPAFVPTPRFALRLALGEMADALLLQSQRVRPQRLLDTGFEFRHPTLEGALRHALGRGEIEA